MERDMDALVGILRRWWWALLIAPIIGGLALYLVSQQQQPMYKATALLWVQTAPGAAGPDPNAFQGDIARAEMYRTLVTVAPVLSPVIAKLDLPYGLEGLRSRLTASIVRDTPLLQVTAADPNPEQAANIADEVVRSFGASINQLGAAGVSKLPPPPGAAAASNSNLIIRSVPAEVPLEPYAPRPALYTLLGAAIALLVVVGAIGLAEYLGKGARTRPSVGLLPEDAPSMAIPRAASSQSARD